MKVIHIFHVFTKLSTLKHSWNLTIFTLKHSCRYAETLLRSIYTCIYLYKKTYSCQPQTVNNFFLKKFLSCLTIAFISIFVTACSCSHISYAEEVQDAALHLSSPPYKHFEQVQGDELHPVAYFTCGEWHNLCHASSKENIKKFSNFYSMKNETTSTSHHLSGGK